MCRVGKLTITKTAGYVNSQYRNSCKQAREVKRTSWARYESWGYAMMDRDCAVGILYNWATIQAFLGFNGGKNKNIPNIAYANLLASYSRRCQSPVTDWDRLLKVEEGTGRHGTGQDEQMSCQSVIFR